MRKDEMEVGVTYIICPEKKCKLFFDTTRLCPCDGSCPFQAKQKLAIVCHSCGGIIVLDGGHSMIVRIDHRCFDGDGLAFNFRMSGLYRLLYSIPKR